MNKLLKKLTPILFGIILGTVVSPIVMGIVFFLVVTPTGLALRILGKNLLQFCFFVGNFNSINNKLLIVFNKNCN